MLLTEILKDFSCRNYTCSGGLQYFCYKFSYIQFLLNKQTPVEILHTILLGSEKYLLGKTMRALCNDDKMKIKARIETFDFSAFPQK